MKKDNTSINIYKGWNILIGGVILNGGYSNFETYGALFLIILILVLIPFIVGLAGGLTKPKTTYILPGGAKVEPIVITKKKLKRLGRLQMLG